MIVSFSVIAIIAKINTKMKIKVVNNIPNNRVKFICVINIPELTDHIYVFEMSRKVLNVSDLAYTILCGLTSSMTLLPRLLT
jgi:hypothetical protein